MFRERGAKVDYNDPYVPVLPKTRQYNFKMKSIKLTVQNISKYDVVIFSTDHDVYDKELLLKHSKLIIDSRNVYKNRISIFGKVFKA